MENFLLSDASQELKVTFIALSSFCDSFWGSRSDDFRQMYDVQRPNPNVFADVVTIEKIW